MSGRGKGDPMAGLLSNLGGIDPNLFNKPTMGQLRNKQQPPASAPKPAVQAPRSDTIAAVGSPARSDAGPSDSFSSQKGNAAKHNPERSGMMSDDLDSFFGSAKPSAAPSNAGSYAPSPANMASPAASLGLPDSQQDADFFGSFGSPAAQRASGSPSRHAQHQQAAMDPFDLFGEGATVLASAAASSHQAAANQQAGADNGLFGDVQGAQDQSSPPFQQRAASKGAPDAQRADMMPSKSPKSVSSSGQAPPSQGRSQLPRRSSSFTSAGSPDSRSSVQDSFFQDGTPATDRQAANRGTFFADTSPATDRQAGNRGTPGTGSGKGSFTRQGSNSSLDTTAGVQGSPNTSASPINLAGKTAQRSGLGKPQRTPSLRSRRSSEEGQGSHKGPLQEGAAAADFGDPYSDPYMHDDPYMSGGQSGGRASSSNVEQTAKQWLTGGQKWLKSAGKKLATAAKESASEIQKRLETVDIKKGKGTKVGDDGEEVAAYYHQWAAKIQDMSPARQADVLDQLGEEDRLIVQRILDSAAVKRSNSSTRSGFSHSPSQHARNQPASPTGSDDSLPPPSYQEAAGTARAGNSRPSDSRPAVAGDLRQSAQGDPSRSSKESASASRHEGQPKARTAADLGVFGDAEDAQSSDFEQPEYESRSANSRAAESGYAEPARGAAATAAVQQPPQKPQPAVAAEADFLGFGNEEAAQEAFMPDSPPAESSQRPGGQAFQPSYPPPPGSNSNPNSNQQAATPDGLADFFSAPSGPSASSSGASHTPSSTAHIDDMFSAGPKPKTAAAAAASSAQSSSVNARSQGALSSSSGAAAGARATPKAAPRAAAPSSMIDFGDEAALLAEHPDLYKGLEEVPGEPEYRKELRQKRLRDMHQRMQAQLAEKQARDAAESTEKEEKVDLRGRVVKPRIDAWTQGKKDNIRALLSTLHTVLWEGSGWKAPQMTDLVEAGKVKKQYMKANLIIHPDKVKQKGGTVEQIVIADMAFDVLKTAWAKFESGELRK